MIDSRAWTSPIGAGASADRGVPSAPNAATCCASGPRAASVASIRARTSLPTGRPKWPPMPHISAALRRVASRPRHAANTRSIASSIRSMPNSRSARARAAAPIRARSAASVISRSSAAASAGTSFGGTIRPVSPSITASRIAPTVVDTAGRPQAAACISDCGTPSSPYDGSAAMSRQGSHSGTSSRLPTKRTSARSPIASTRASRCARRGPSPITSSCQPGTRARSSAQASSSGSWPFQSRSVATMPTAGRPSTPHRARIAARSCGRKRARSMPVRTDVMRAGSKPLSRTSWSFSASPVTTMCAVARWYIQRVVGERFTRVDTCRVRTTGGIRDSVSIA